MVKKKKAIINPKNNDDKCFQYTLTVTLNHEQRITRIKSFLDQ